MEEDEGLNHTWENFKEFLLKILKDPTNHKKNISQCLTNTYQCDTQFIWDFAHYLDVLQNQIYSRTKNLDAWCIKQLRTRVKNKIRQKSNHHANIPTIYYKYVNHLANMKENINKASDRKP